MSIQDRAIGINYYLDRYNFGWYQVNQNEGQHTWLYYPYFGRGPNTNRPSNWLTMGETVGENIALAMPPNYTPGQDVYNQLSNAEKQFVATHPELAIEFYGDTNEALSEAGSRFTQEELVDGRGDAWRHAYWSALMVKTGASFSLGSIANGAALAEEYGNARESRPGNNEHAKSMDLYNNSVGRRIAVDNPNATPAQLRDLVTQALNNGDFLVICPGPTCPATAPR